MLTSINLHSHTKTSTTPLKITHSASKKKGISLTRDGHQTLKNQTFASEVKFRSLSGRVRNEDNEHRQIKLSVRTKDVEVDKTLTHDKDASQLNFSVNRKINFDNLA